MDSFFCSLKKKAVLLLTLTFTLLSGSAFGQNYNMINQVAPPKTGWSPECLALDQTHNCGKGKESAFAENLRNQIIASPKVQDNQVSEFFWNFLIDQDKQTKCEKNMLSTLNLTSNVDDCHNSVSHTNRQGIDQTYPIQSQAALKMQKEILNHVYKALPEIARAKRLCDDAEKNLQHIQHRSILKTTADVITGNASGAVADHYANTLSESSAKSDMTVACSAYQGIVAKLWSGETPEMQLYLSVWADRENKATAQGHPISEADFMKEAIPLAKVDHGNQVVTTDYAPADHPLAFNDAVIVSMGCRAQARAEKLSGAIQGGVPINGSNNNADVRVTLMNDVGTSALNYLKRSKYHENGAGLACQIKKEYWTIPHEEKMIMQTAEVGVGIAAVVVTGGAAAGAFFGPASALALSAATVTSATMVIGSASAALSIGRLFMTSSNTCASVISPETLQPQPICELFANTKPGQVPQDFSSQLQKRDSCMGQVINAVVATLGVAGTLMHTPQNAAELTEILTLENAADTLEQIKKAKDLGMSANGVIKPINGIQQSKQQVNQ